MSLNHSQKFWTQRVVLLYLLLITTAISAYAGSIQGTVIDKDGKELPNLTIQLNYKGGCKCEECKQKQPCPICCGNQITTTNSNGFFSIPNIQSGVYVIEIEAAKYKFYRSDRIGIEPDTELKLTIRLNAKKEGEFITRSAKQDSLIKGTVTNENGQPIKGVKLLFINRDGSRYFSTMTDDNGSFSVGVLPGNYFVSGILRNLEIGSLPNIISVRAREKKKVKLEIVERPQSKRED